MRVEFPSTEFFLALRRLMAEDESRFRRLGFVDTTFGVHVVDPGGQDRRFLLTFEVFECREVREVETFADHSPDFVIQGERAVWEDMLANIRERGQADAAHSLNTLTHFGERLQIVYDDPDGRDKFFRFQESLQEFFDLAAKLNLAPAGQAAEEPPRGSTS
jgi:hypothetical protein